MTVLFELRFVGSQKVISKLQRTIDGLVNRSACTHDGALQRFGLLFLLMGKCRSYNVESDVWDIPWRIKIIPVSPRYFSSVNIPDHSRSSYLFRSKFPGRWITNESSRKTLKDNQTTVHISNATTKSGKIVTAWYILFKAARTTLRTRFLQSLCIKPK